MATGGEAVARLDDGRVIFVSGACADETVRVALTEQKKRFARGQTLAVLEPSVDRQALTCVHAEAGECGGCDWMHLNLEAQRTAKVAIVREQLERLGGLAAPLVQHRSMERVRRTTIRCRVIDGRAGYRSRRSHDSFAATECGAVDPSLEQLLVEGRYGDATEVALRVAGGTGQRMVVTDGQVRTVSVPEDALVVSAADSGDAALIDVVAGREWRISAKSFFQTSTDGAEALVAAVGETLTAAEQAAGVSAGDVVDLYAGVGLLGGSVCADRLVGAVESNPSSASDAVANLGPHVTVSQERVERWTATPASTVIADPARRGLGAEGVPSARPEPPRLCWSAVTRRHLDATQPCSRSRAGDSVTLPSLTCSPTLHASRL